MSSEQRDDMSWCQFVDGVYGPVYSFVRWMCSIFPERRMPERSNALIAFSVELHSKKADVPFILHFSAEVASVSGPQRKVADIHSLKNC